MDAMMAELYGKATGYCKGKGGSVHLADFQRGILGANGIVGAGIAIATGAAMSAKMQDTRQVALAFFGDGAVNQGAFHESLNTAVFMQLPAIYVCENNQYAVSMPASKATSSKTIADRGRSYGMSSVQVDGQNVLAVYDAAKRAVERARRGEGPSFIECLTYRFRGHWEGETVELRSASEMEHWQRQDPIQGLEQAMLDAGIVSEERLREIWDHICDEVAEAIRFAEQSPEPEPEEAVQDVLSGAIAAQPG
jgi:TPP-dependent pyruvate/acetoin dehydrogenase alpha subunit